jgi:lipopolysaccharide export LptBFGC system permease protein LptF
MVTLHGYILRELLKTFGLALAALTALFTMGGGLYNVVRFEGISATDVFAFIPILIPIVVTLTMPMAALFAATMVYGRLAADNELQACRAAGINIHRLLLSVVLLAVFVAAFTMLVGNFVIPDFMQQIDNFARSNVRDLVAQQLQHKGFIHRGRADEPRYTITAEKVQGVSDAALRAKGFEVADGLSYLLITNPTFLNVDRGGELVRFTVAQHVLCAFDTRVSPLEVTFHVQDGEDFEVGKRALRIDQQQIGPVQVPLPSPFRLTTTDLRALWRWRRAPWEVPKMLEGLQRFLTDMTRLRFGAYCAAHLQNGRTLRLTDDYGQEYAISARNAQAASDGATLNRVHIEVRTPQQVLKTVYDADLGEISAAPFLKRMLVGIRLNKTATRDVLEYDVRAGVKTSPRHKEALSIEQVLLPAEVQQEIGLYTAQAVLDPTVSLPTDGALAGRRLGLQKLAREYARKIVATINFRLGYTSSVLVTLLMGAALGVIFRGSRALAAFALALVPFFTVLVLIVIGQKLTEDAQTTRIGPLVAWGSLVLVLVADGFIVRLGVRR